VLINILLLFLQEHPPGDRDNDKNNDSKQASGENHDKDEESTSPSTNYKYRKKTYGMDDTTLSECLGKLAKSDVRN